MNTAVIRPDDSTFPRPVVDGIWTRSTITALGNVDLLRRASLALFCSIRCPGKLILETYDFARAVRDVGVPIVSGFHTPMEKECLDLLLRGTQPVLVCPARSI
jgi:hypothetical protein